MSVPNASPSEGHAVIEPHPSLPKHRPLAIAHRGGNTVARSLVCLAAGADLLETDVHLQRGNVELRHAHRWGPILWERWRVWLRWRPQERVQDLLNATDAKTLLFLDLKSNALELGTRLLADVRQIATDRVIAVCGRNYSQLDAIANAPGVVAFYSVGDPAEWDLVWPRLRAMEHPAISLRSTLADEQTMSDLKAIGATVICWTVNTEAELDRVLTLGADGVTTDNLDLIRSIVKRRESIPQPPEEPQPTDSAAH